MVTQFLLGAWPYYMPGAAVLIVAILFGSRMITFRAPSLRQVLFEALGRVKGIPIVWIECPAAAARVLKASSIKGEFLERTFSAPAFLPLLSLESADDPQWSVLKAHLTTFMHSLPPVTSLQSIAHRVTLESMSALNRLDADAISSISVATFFEWIFERAMPTDVRQLMCAATWEWRKEIAVKGKGDMALKQRAVDAIVHEILATPHVCHVFGARQWTDPEFFSVLIQPFLVSPAINISDIAVQVRQQLVHTNTRDPAKNITDLIHAAMDSAHPFVLLERFLPLGLHDDLVQIAPGTHVFIPVDMITTDAAIRFGAGGRKCPGTHLGMACMLGIFSAEVLQHDKFQPHVGHLYSGRDQDGQESLQETIFQGAQIAAALWAAFLARIRGALRAQLKNT
ncbi:hypothetical protein DYB37_001713 [Aphanomyces astaci]|uniref:Cytochrome P450 n=1 Tax=Aphanomyces astaci TaxID=112090 RepID=A0A3R7EEK7_APHAT|nr:hypothetical protein DYB35_007552 [Aphanomyces astaci]RHZ03657.1 hypothetical protein DYB37_001713 [Aphanomyces astaci]